MIRPHPLIPRTAPATNTVTGADSLPGECKRCEYCWTRMFGCTTTGCYCHHHPLEPLEAA